MHVNELHSWPATSEEALALQERLRDRVRLAPIDTIPARVAGADVAYCAERRRLFAAAAVLALPSLDVIEVSVVERAETFPYVPGLFAFRELPALLDALAGLSTTPDVVLFDGHGVAHPRRFGLASHAGLWLRVPTVGCAKCVLTGRFRMPADERGAVMPLAVDGEVVGAALRTRPGTMPMFVSPGHLADVESSLRVVMAATGKHRTPEPLRAAHHAAVSRRDSSSVHP
ncbi:MAG: endonuclease V [Bacteroidales bacterium]